MAIKKIIKSAVVPKEPILPEITVVQETPLKEVRSKRVCHFCTSKTNPSYTELSSLRRFLTDRAKIVAKERSGVCSKHQRAVAKNIKYARHLALLPFVPKV